MARLEVFWGLAIKPASLSFLSCALKRLLAKYVYCHQAHAYDQNKGKFMIIEVYFEFFLLEQGYLHCITMYLQHRSRKSSHLVLLL